MNRKAVFLFVPILVLLTIGTLIYAYVELNHRYAKTNERTGQQDLIGRKTIDLTTTYYDAQRAMLYTDYAAAQSLPPALYCLGQQGGQTPTTAAADTEENSFSCPPRVYPQWTTAEKECYPDAETSLSTLFDEELSGRLRLYTDQPLSTHLYRYTVRSGPHQSFSDTPTQRVPKGSIVQISATSTSPYTFSIDTPIKMSDAKAAPAKYSGSGLIWPLPGYSTINSCFGFRGAITEQGSTDHPAIDIPAPRGTPVVAAAEGTISVVDERNGRVIIEHTPDLSTQYQHMDTIDPAVTVKARVVKGQRVGTVGGRGPEGPNQYSPHLDFAVILPTIDNTIKDDEGRDIILSSYGQKQYANPICFFDDTVNVQPAPDSSGWSLSCRSEFEEGGPFCKQTTAGSQCSQAGGIGKWCELYYAKLPWTQDTIVPEPTTTEAKPIESLFRRVDIPTSVLAKSSSRGGTKIDYIILHHTANNGADSAIISWKTADASAHYLVERDGSIIPVIPEDVAAWHAGCKADTHKCYFTDMNSRSIGIEIVNCGRGKPGEGCAISGDWGIDPYPEAQRKAVDALVRYLRAKYDVSNDNIIGHGCVTTNKDENEPTGFEPLEGADWNIIRNGEDARCTGNPDTVLAQNAKATQGSNPSADQTRTCAIPVDFSNIDDNVVDKRVSWETLERNMEENGITTPLKQALQQYPRVPIELVKAIGRVESGGKTFPSASGKGECDASGMCTCNAGNYCGWLQVSQTICASADGCDWDRLKAGNALDQSVAGVFLLDELLRGIGCPVAKDTKDYAFIAACYNAGGEAVKQSALVACSRLDLGSGNDCYTKITWKQMTREDIKKGLQNTKIGNSNAYDAWNGDTKVNEIYNYPHLVLMGLRQLCGEGYTFTPTVENDQAYISIGSYAYSPALRVISPGNMNAYKQLKSLSERLQETCARDLSGLESVQTCVDRVSGILTEGTVDFNLADCEDASAAYAFADDIWDCSDNDDDDCTCALNLAKTDTEQQFTVVGDTLTINTPELTSHQDDRIALPSLQYAYQDTPGGQQKAAGSIIGKTDKDKATLEIVGTTIKAKDDQISIYKKDGTLTFIKNEGDTRQCSLRKDHYLFCARTRESVELYDENAKKIITAPIDIRWSLYLEDKAPPPYVMYGVLRTPLGIQISWDRSEAEDVAGYVIMHDSQAFTSRQDVTTIRLRADEAKPDIGQVKASNTLYYSAIGEYTYIFINPTIPLLGNQMYLLVLAYDRNGNIDTTQFASLVI
ncbi:MAG: N-acetylmuramoyl-L-alanine amidase [Nanoarchaeota archaeon]